MSKKISKIVAVVMLFLNVTNSIFASTIQDRFGSYSIYYHDDPISYVKYGTIKQKNYEYYYLDENGSEETVYCLNLGKEGAEKNNGYKLSANEVISDNVLASIIANAYPYKSIQELGLETVSEARFASQFAIWTYTSNLDLSILSANEEKYQRVVNAINNIYNNGVNGNSSISSLVQIHETNGVAGIDNINSNYYSKEYKIEKNSNVESIVLKSSNKDVIITDINNNIITDISCLDSFKVLVPVSIVNENINVNLNFETKLKENIALFGVAENEGMQNVAVTFSPISIQNLDVNFNVNKVDSVIKIIKVDKEDESIKIPGVKFKISDASTGKVYGEYVTDNNGEILIDVVSNLKLSKEGKIKIEEIEVPQGYYIDYDDNIKEVDVKFGNINSITFKNQKIKGTIKIVKTSLKDNLLSNILGDMPLEGAKFGIYDLNGNKIEEITTNKEGIAISSDLVFGKYKLKEIESPSYYKTNDNEIEFEISKNGEQILINVKNDNIEMPKRLPNTGC